MENHLYKGHSLYMDNYHNSIDLAHKLLEKKNILQTNTSKQSKKKCYLRNKKKLNTGKSISKYTKYGVCVTKWKDRREVLTISSEYR